MINYTYSYTYVTIVFCVQKIHIINKKKEQKNKLYKNHVEKNCGALKKARQCSEIIDVQQKIYENAFKCMSRSPGLLFGYNTVRL